MGGCEKAIDPDGEELKSALEETGPVMKKVSGSSCVKLNNVKRSLWKSS